MEFEVGGGIMHQVDQRLVTVAVAWCSMEKLDG